MKIQRMPEDIVPLLNDLVRRITALETRPLGTVFVNETIIAKDPETGVETIIGDLTEYGEDRTGIKQWVNDTEPPAVPVMPIVTSNLGVFSIVWTGFFEDDAPMAPDFSHLNVYGNNGTSTKLVGVIKTKDEVAIVTLDSEAMYDEVWSFWFTSVDQVGNESVPGPISANNQLTPLVESPDIQGAIDKVYEKIEKDFEKSMLAANGKNRIWHTPEPPVEDPNAPFIDGDMWFDTNNGNKIHVWKNLPEPGAWEAAVLDSSALDDKVTDLIEDAKNQADVALETANGKNKSYHQPTAPSGTNHRVGDIWFDTDDSNKVYVWNGTEWDPSSASSEIPGSVLDDILYAKNRSDQAFTLANGKNKRVDSINNPPSNTTGYIAGDHWLKWSNLGTTGVLLQSWTVKNGAWVKDSMDPTYLPKVDIGQGTFGSLNGDRLKVNTVSADRILIGATDNVIPDPTFTNNASDWFVGTSTIYSFPVTDGRDGGSAIKITQSGTGQQLGRYSAKVPSVDGDSFRVSVWVKCSVAAPAKSLAIYVTRYQTGSTTPSNPANVSTNDKIIPANTWTRLEGTYTVLDNTTHISFGVFKQSILGESVTWFSDFSAIRMSGMTLIEDGAITTKKIEVGAITAESGIIASLDAGKIVTGSMHGKYIEAGTLLASKLAVRNNENLLPNLTYEAEDWVLSGGTTIVNSTLSSEGKRLSFPPTALAQAIAYDVQVIPGEKYKVEANTYGTTASQNLEICWFGRDGKGVGAGSAVLIKSSTANQKLSTEWEAPANVFSVRFSIRVPSTSPVNTSATGAYNFTVRKMTGTVLIENGAVTADQIKSGTITANSGVIASLDASKITVGEMDGKLIKINSILADRLVVGDFENYATVDPVLGTNVSHSSYKTETVGNYASAIGTGAYFMFRNPSNSVPFELGDKLRVTFDAKSSNTSNQNVTAQLWTYLGLNGSGGGAAYFPGTSTTITPTEKRYEMFIEITSDISAAKSWIVGLSQAGSKNVLLRNITVRRMAKGELIVDGAILANHIHADSVEARHIKANAVTADKIEAGAIKTSHLSVGTGRELVGNGSGQLKNNTGFESFKYGARSSSTPVGHPGYFYSTAGQGTTNFLTGDSILRVKPNTKYKISVWVRASASGSNVYLEPMTGSTASGDRTTPIYPFQQLAVPTAWTYWTTEFTTGTADSGNLYFRWFLNHSTGTNTNTIFYFTGFSVEEMVEGTVIADGAITTNKIAANTITADKMTIGVGSNLFGDPLIKDKAEWVGTNISVVDGGGRNASGNAMRITSVGSQRGTYYGTTNADRRIPVVPGRSYRVTAWIRPSVNTSVGSNFSMYGRLYSQDGTAATWASPSNGNASYITDVAPISSSTWTKFEVEFLVPENSANTFFAPGFFIQSGYPSGNTLDWCDISVTEMSSGELIVDGAIDGKVITGALIQTDRAENVGVKLSNQGIEAYGPDGEKTLKITGGNGTGVDYIGVWGHKDAVVDASGNVVLPAGQDAQTVASIDPTGIVSSRELSVDEYARMDGNVVINGDPLTESHLGTESAGEWGPVINGRSILGTTFTNFVDEHPQVSDITSWLTPLSHGFVANAYTNTDAGAAGSLSSDGRWKWSGNAGGLIERAMLQETVEIVNNRGYLITYNTPAIRETSSGSSSSVGACLLRYQVNGSPNIGGGTVLQNSRTYINGGGNYDNPGRTIFVVGGQDLPAGSVTLSLQVYTYANRTMETTNTADARYWNISVMDLGLATKGNTGKVVNLYKKLPPSSGGSGETSTPPPVTPPKPKQYTKTWNASWWGTYDSSGTNTYFDSRGRVAQGKAPGVSGVQRGLVGFPSVTSTLSGATVKKVEVYVYAAHWYYSGGGTLVLGTHGATSKPSSYASGNIDVKRQKMAKPEGRWITLPSSTYAGFKSGSRRGIQTYINSSSLSYYGYLTGSKSKLRITYTK